MLLVAGILSAFSTTLLWAAPGAPKLPAVTLPDDDTAVSAASAEGSRALRLSSVEGQARVVQDGQIVADPALANMPLFAGTQITTANDGRVEIQLEDGSVVRISPNSTLTLTVLEKHGTSTHTEVAVNNGLIYFELQPSNSEHSLRVNYGAASFAATSYTVARVILDTPPGDLAVFSGNVHLDRGNALQLDVHGGESLGLDTTDQTRYNLTETIQPDSWDTWNADRDQELNAIAGQRTVANETYANSGTVGMADLDANGSWYNVPGQGYLWSPYEAQAQGAGWDPYGFGHWVYYPGRGYVWVSGYGWGYASFDCGLWNYYDSFGWGWQPGNGCSPWWGLGGGGWGYNIGNGPRGYRPPHRPILPPGHPHPVNSRALVASNVVSIDRRLPGGGDPKLYTHPAQPVTIAGHTVEPLKPVAARQSYDRTTTASVHSGSGYFPAPSRTATSGTRPMPTANHSSTSASTSSHGSSSGGSHASYSGGGGGSSGGGGHVSSGGGGGSTGGGSAGGGGGSHK